MRSFYNKTKLSTLGTELGLGSIDLNNYKLQN